MCLFFFSSVCCAFVFLHQHFERNEKTGCGLYKSSNNLYLVCLGFERVCKSKMHFLLEKLSFVISLSNVCDIWIICLFIKWIICLIQSFRATLNVFTKWKCLHNMNLLGRMHLYHDLDQKFARIKFTRNCIEHSAYAYTDIFSVCSAFSKIICFFHYFYYN